MIEFKFQCPKCGQKLSGDPANSGRQIACPTCQETITIPATAPAPVMKAPLADAATVSTPPPPSPIPPAAASRQPLTPDRLSRLAVVSLICSVFVPLGAVPGIICGHLARARMRRDFFLVGEKMANAGLLISYAVLLATVVAAAIFFFEHQYYRPLQMLRETPDALAAMQARVVDEVIMGENEDEHEVDGVMQYTTEDRGKSYHTANRGGSFSYMMKTLPDRALTLNCRYSGDENRGHLFDIAVDDRIIATQDLTFIAHGHWVDIEYKIPTSLTSGKTKVKVEFQAHAGKTAGGLYGCQILKR
jgi:hypothetical protein